jgi:hypothetical protein
MQISLLKKDRGQIDNSSNFATRLFKILEKKGERRQKDKLEGLEE